MLALGLLVVLDLGNDGRTMISDVEDIDCSSSCCSCCDDSDDDDMNEEFVDSVFINVHSLFLVKGLVGFDLDGGLVRLLLTISSASKTDAAVTMVLLLAKGAGVGEFDLKSGCI